MVTPTLRVRRSAWRSLLTVLWQQPFLAIPFALFFVAIGTASWRALPTVYLISLVFAYCIRLAVWAAEQFVAPRLLKRDPHLRKGGVLRQAGLYMASSVVGAYSAAIVVHLTVLPGFLGSARGVLAMSMFTLLFTLLVTGMIYAWQFYHAALGKVRAEEEMNLARRIQRGFLLTAFPRRPRLEMHAVNLSSREVSGDFYDVVPAGDGAFLVAVADVSGKGVPAALLSSMLQASLRTQAGLERSTAAIMRNLNRLVCESTSREQFATFFLALVDERALSLTFTNAGHNPPLLLRRGAATRTLECGGTVIGMLDAIGFQEETVALAPGDRIVAYTDGFSEAQRPDGVMFGDDRVARLAGTLDDGLSAEATCEHLIAELRRWLAGRDAGDDVTLLALRVLDEAPATVPQPARG